MDDHAQTSYSYAVEISALVRVHGDEVRPQVCQLRTMSLEGTFLELGRLSAGTLVNITFDLPTSGEQLSLDGVVNWSTDTGAAVQFEGVRAREIWALWRYLELVSGLGPESCLCQGSEVSASSEATVN